MKRKRLPDRMIISTKVKTILGISARTLRDWDKKGILKPYMRTPGGTRLYREKDIIKFVEKYRIYKRR